MRPVRTVALGVLPLILVGLGTAPAVGDNQAAPADTGVSQAAATSVLKSRPGAAHTFVQPTAARTVAPQTATFQVTYSGFTRAARRAFQRAVNLWAPLVTSTVPITVSAQFQPAGNPNNLGSAGPSNIWRDFAGAPQPGTWYVDAVANKRFGAQLNPSADIVANFNSTRTDWYFGAAGTPPAGRYDFTTVVLHELGHGLGFLGAGNVTGSTGTVRLDGLPIAYDRFTENGAGTKLLTLPDNSTQLANALRSNNVFFDTTRVRNANAGLPARLYAPATWAQGSSYSHLNEATYGPGNANSLMTPFLASAEVVHDPGPIVDALFKSTGW